MRLAYIEPLSGRGKTTEDSDEIDVRFTKISGGKRIEEEVWFQSDDLAFSGLMRMIWTLEAVAGGTLVTVRAENVPSGIRPEDHEAGLNSTIENLAALVRTAG